MYDLLIIGAGPAGMTAGIYAKRANLKVAMIERSAPGGQIVNTWEIENYTGFTKMNGAELATKMFEHTQDIGVEYLYGDVLSIEDLGNVKKITTDVDTYETKAIIIATGTIPRRLGVDNEDRFASNGISWCAICDGPFYKGRKVAVIGGGNSAVEEATYLASFCEHVTVIQNLDQLTADPHAQDLLRAMPNVDFHFGATVESFLEKDNELAGVRILTKEKETLDVHVHGVFEYIGLLPVTDMVKDLGITNPYGYILTDERMSTSVNGVFAAGDVREKHIRQVVTATNDGAIAVQSVLRYLERLK